MNIAALLISVLSLFFTAASVLVALHATNDSRNRYKLEIWLQLASEYETFKFHYQSIDADVRKLALEHDREDEHLGEMWVGIESIRTTNSKRGRFINSDPRKHSERRLLEELVECKAAIARVHALGPAIRETLIAEGIGI